MGKMAGVLSEKLINFFNLHKTIFIVGLITLFGAILRIYHLGFKSLWLDEAALYWISQGSIKQVIIQNAKGNSAPFLYSLLIHFSSIFNKSEFGLRFISMASGVMIIPTFYLLARRFLSERISYYSIFFIAIASNQIKYSQELREYSITFLLSILMLYLFDKYLENRSIKDCFWLMIVSIIGLFTQYGLAILIFTFNIVLFLNLIKNQTKIINEKWFILSQIYLLIAVFFVYITSLKYQMRSGGFGATTYLSNNYASKFNLISIFNLVIKGFESLINFSFSGGSIVIFLLILGLYQLFVYKRSLIKISYTIIPFAITIILAIFKLYPFGAGRQNMFLIPLIYLLFGLTLEFLWSLKQKIIFYVIIIILCFYGLYSTLNQIKSTGIENMRLIVSKINKAIKRIDKIYVYYGSIPAFKYYYLGDMKKVVLGDYCRNNINKCKNQIDKVIKSKDTVWYVYTHCYKNECEEIKNILKTLKKKGSI